jgi:hypothetical protein
LNKDAEFNNLRAAGAFLVNAFLKYGKVLRIEVLSEAGAPLKMLLPWKAGSVTSNISGTLRISTRYIEMKTKKGEYLKFEP